MRLHISLFALLLPLVLAAKEVPGEELPASDATSLLKNDDDDHNSDQASFDGSSMVKRSISEIAARRRSALDKSFMRFGRSDPSISEPRVKLGGGSLMRFGRSKQNSFLRLGRGRPQDFMRFGRSTGNMMRFGRAANLMRFGRGGNNMMRFGRGGNNMMRFGRGGNNMMRFGRGGNNMMRFGRGGNNMMRFGRGGNNMMRFGRSDNDFLNYENDPEFDIEEDIDNDTEMTPTPSDAYVRVERSIDADKNPKASNYADRQNDNFMRLGRSLLQKSYDDNEEEEGNLNQDQYIASALDNENDRISSIQKNKMYLDDKLMRLGRERIENPDEIQDSLELIFPEESRWKRSLIKVDPSKKPSVASDSSDEHPEVSSVRHSSFDAMENCSS